MVGIRDETNLTLYVDGINVAGADASAVGSLFFAGANVTLRLGVGLKGTLDDFLILNRSITSDEVTALFNSTKTFHNFTGLTNSTHTFQASTVDAAGNVNQTELRTVNAFIIPPPKELQIWRNASAMVNVSSVNIHGDWLILGIMNVTNSGFFNFLGGINNRIASGWFTSLVSLEINSTNITAINYHSRLGNVGLSTILNISSGDCNQTFESGLLTSFQGCA